MESILTREERIVFGLRALYSKFGYRPYRMSKFEEYDLYAGNRSFLPSGRVITFTDTNGRLMALKPDVTLSIAKNLGGGPDSTPEKLYYDESVYRAPDSGLGFQEITQAGLEYLGPVDGYVMGEVAMLAARSLGEISPDWVLDLSHMGYLCALVDELGLRGPERAELLRAVGSRSAQAMRAVCTAAGAPEEPADRLIRLVELYGPATELLPELRALAATEAELAAADELEDTVRVLASFGCVGGVNIDLSITCDTEYYNGLVFKGYVPGAPSAVLSGGRYDSLMRKLGKDEQAIGFAVYLNLLERLGGAEPEYDADVLLIPDGETPEELAGVVREMTDSGRSVRVQSGATPSLRCRTVMKMMDGRPVELEGDDCHSPAEGQAGRTGLRHVRARGLRLPGHKGGQPQAHL